MLRVLLVFSSLAIVGGGGYLVAARGLVPELRTFLLGRFAPGEASAPPAASHEAIVYYRHPDGLPEYSSTAKTSSDGRPFHGIRQSEDVSFDPLEPGRKAAMTEPAGADRPVLYYRNPMGLPDTSKVPKKDSMGMDYIPVFAGDQAESAVVKVSPGKLQRTGVRIATAERAAVRLDVRVPGTIAFDERLTRIVSMRADSFIDDVANVTTGDRVRKGDELFHFFSKEIARAGAEYVTEILSAKPDSNIGAALQLRNLGVPGQTISSIARTKVVPRSIPYLSPSDGVVVERGAVTGMMAEAGNVLFRIVDTSRVWVMADIPEYDAATIGLGAAATVRIRNLPGKTFQGAVDLIYPEVQMQTRTTRVRIELPNPEGLLLANMYAEVDIEAGNPSAVVAVPNSAIIDTGDRRMVFIDKGEGRFEPREVSLGLRGREKTEIASGIEEGERIVVSANFLLDAESNLQSAFSALASSEVTP